MGGEICLGYESLDFPDAYHYAYGLAREMAAKIDFDPEKLREYGVNRLFHTNEETLIGITEGFDEAWIAPPISSKDFSLNWPVIREVEQE